MAAREHGLGRVVVRDDNDRSFPMAAALSRLDPGITYRYWDAGWRGDQGDKPHCVAYSMLHWLEAMGRPGDPDRWDPPWIYRQAQKVDEYPGVNYDGTTVRAGAKILRREGLISSFRWAWDIATIAQTIRSTGPVIAGTTWREAMDEPDANGFIRPDGASLGGHAYLLSGVNMADRFFRIDNSWGPTWGVRGRAKISFDHFDQLLADYGEACLLVPHAVT